MSVCDVCMMFGDDSGERDQEELEDEEEVDAVLEEVLEQHQHQHQQEQEKVLREEEGEFQGTVTQPAVLVASAEQVVQQPPPQIRIEIQEASWSDYVNEPRPGSLL